MNIKDFLVKRISYEETKFWILNVHYAKRMPSISFAYGLFHNDKLLGIVTYGSPASQSLCKGVCGIENRNHVIELNRLVLSPNCPKNSASFLISKSIKLLPKPKIIVSYADSQYAHFGYVYQASNWIYTGATKPRTDAYAGEGKHSRHHKGDLTKRIFRSSKHRYIYFHGCSKTIKSSLRYKIFPYPKGIIQKYEINKNLFLGDD